MKRNKDAIKKYFETGDVPTEAQYIDLIDSYVDSKQTEGEDNRRFVINAIGEVEVVSEQKIPTYTLSEIAGNRIALLKDGVTVKEIDLTPYIDDTNLARLVSGTVNSRGVATFKRDDNSTFKVDFSSLVNSRDLIKKSNISPEFVTNYWRGSLGQFQGISIKDNNTLYYVKEEKNRTFQENILPVFPNNPSAVSIGDSYFNDNGTKLFTSYASNFREEFIIKEFLLTKAYDVSTARPSGVELDLTSYKERSTAGIGRWSINESGTRLFFVDTMGVSSFDDTMKVLNLTTPFDLTTATLEVENKLALTQLGGAGYVFSPDGMMLIMRRDAGFFQYSLDRAYDLETAKQTYSATVASVIGNTGWAMGNPKFSIDGKRLFFPLTGTVGLTEFHLTTPYDFSTARKVGVLTSRDVLGFVFNREGTELSSITNPPNFTGTTSFEYHFNKYTLVAPFDIVNIQGVSDIQMYLGSVRIDEQKDKEEYTLSLTPANHSIVLLKNGITISEIDIAPYIDDTNLARLVSGTLDVNGVATFTRDDNSTFTVDLSNLKNVPSLEEVINVGSSTSRTITVDSGSGIIGEYKDYAIKFTNKSEPVNNLTIQSPSPSTMNSGTNHFISIPFKTGTFALLDDVKNYRAGTNITIDNSNPSEPIINALSGNVTETDVALTNTYNEINSVETQEVSVGKITLYGASNTVNFSNPSITFPILQNNLPLKLKITGLDGSIGYLNIISISSPDSGTAETFSYVDDNNNDITDYTNFPFDTPLDATVKQSLPPTNQSDFNTGVLDYIKRYVPKTFDTILGDNEDPTNKRIVFRDHNNNLTFVNSGGIYSADNNISIGGGNGLDISSLKGNVKITANNELLLKAQSIKIDTNGYDAILDTSHLDSNTGTGTVSYTLPKKTGVLAMTSDIPELKAGTNITIDNSNPLEPIINASDGQNENTVTLDTNQTITGEKTIRGNLFTGYIQSDNSLSVGQNITTGGRIRTGGNALDFTERGNAGSATIEANIVGSTKHTLQPKSGIIAHLDDIVGAQKASINVTGNQLNFDGTKASDIILVPAQTGKIILVKSIIIERLLTKPVEQSYASAYVGYSLEASGYPLNLTSINLSETNDLISYESNIQFSQVGNNFDEQPIGVPLVIKGEDGIGMTGAEGNLHITIEYEYYTTFKKNVS